MSDKKLILVADDDDDFRELIALCLRQKNTYEILEACDGREALETAVDQSPDLILLDLMMPVMDGFQVASELTAKLGIAAPKILIITGRNLVEEDVAILLSGATGIMRKPLQTDALLLNVEAVLNGNLGSDWDAIQ